MPGPLDGIKVLELAQIIAGPFCGTALADLGADVVKLESPEGDASRRIGQIAPGESKAFHGLNRGKRGITVDLSTSPGTIGCPSSHSALRCLRDQRSTRRGGTDRDGLRHARPDSVRPHLSRSHRLRQSRAERASGGLGCGRAGVFGSAGRRPQGRSQRRAGTDHGVRSIRLRGRARGRDGRVRGPLSPATHGRRSANLDNVAGGGPRAADSLGGRRPGLRLDLD